MTKHWDKERAAEIKMAAFRQRLDGKRTSKGDLMSLAAIGRTLDPPVTRTAVLLVAEGKAMSERIRQALERELGRPFWMRKRGHPVD